MDDSSVLLSLNLRCQPWSVCKRQHTPPQSDHWRKLKTIAGRQKHLSRLVEFIYCNMNTIWILNTSPGACQLCHLVLCNFSSYLSFVKRIQWSIGLLKSFISGNCSHPDMITIAIVVNIKITSKNITILFIFFHLWPRDHI